MDCGKRPFLLEGAIIEAQRSTRAWSLRDTVEGGEAGGSR